MGQTVGRTTGQGRKEEARVLRLSLHGRLVGYLTGLRGGRNTLLFDRAYREDAFRPTFTLTTQPDWPQADKLLGEPWSKRQRLHPVLSNLLPEGALRAYLAQALKVHVDDEFPLLAALGGDLPGALIVEPVAPEDVPESLLLLFGDVRAVPVLPAEGGRRFSLAGVQMKFSMKQRDGRFNLAGDGELGDWIIKTPSTSHRHVPANEYSAMQLASLVGINIPEIKLVSLDDLGNLPDINLPDEARAFAIRRFDRDGAARIHMEDFAQILFKYPHQKYNAANYTQIAKVLYTWSANPLADVQQLARRLLVNILLANGDAHLKNWSMLYPDQVTPVLSPAYDIVSTRVYIDDESSFALNLGRTKSWNVVTLEHFETWARKADIPWRAIRPHLLEVMTQARELWPAALDDLPMLAQHKQTLRAHWRGLQPDFRIGE